MTGLITKFVFNKILRENVSNNQGREDPYFETVPTSRLSMSGKPKTKKQRKALPPGLTREEEQTLVKVKRRAYRLDMAFGTFCGMKVGWSSLIAIIPAIGDVVDMLLAMMVIRTASEVGLPASVKAQMVFNVAIDFVIGLVPFLGDIMDIAFKANTRNAIVLENYLRQRGAENIRQQGLPPQTDPSLGEVYDEQQVVSQQPIAQPQPSYGGFGRSLFGGGGRRIEDVEAQRPSGSGTAPLRGSEGRGESERHGEGRVSKHMKHGSSRNGDSRREGGARREGGSRHESSRGHSSKPRQQESRGGSGR